jgi:hypothetical protein
MSVRAGAVPVMVSHMPGASSPLRGCFSVKVCLLFVTIIVTYAIYAYLHAYRIDLHGRAYVHLQPLTNALYGLVETYLPVDVRYKIRGAITDDLGQRSLFLLLLTAAVELTLYSFFKFLKYLVAGSRKRA